MSDLALRNELIRIAYYNKETRKEILPLVLAYDKEAKMQKQAFFFKAILKRLGGLFPGSIKRKLKEVSQKLRNSSWKSVYQGLINQIERLGSTVGLKGIGRVIDRAIQKVSLRNLVSAVSFWVQNGIDGLLRFLGIRKEAVASSLQKEATDPWAVVGGTIGIIAIIALTVFVLGDTMDGSFIGMLVSHHILENAIGAISAILEAIAES